MTFILNARPYFNEFDSTIIENIENKIKEKNSICAEESEILLDYICVNVRKLIADDFNNDTLKNKDLLAASIINNYFNELGLTTHICNTRLNIEKSVKNNTFLIVEILENNYGNSAIIPYIVDPTYRQFFTIEKCHDNYDIKKENIFSNRPDPGYYIHPCDREEIIYFLEHGYNFFDPDFASIYGNSFLNTMTTKSSDKLLFDNGLTYYDSFLKGSSIKLLSKDELERDGLLINPIKQKNKKM